MAGKPTQAEVEAALPAEMRAAFRQLVSDYTAAANVHVPDWRGGVNPSVVATLIQQGWQKVPANIASAESARGNARSFVKRIFDAIGRFIR